jgi:hypothetical protein
LSTLMVPMTLTSTVVDMVMVDVVKVELVDV